MNARLNRQLKSNRKICPDEPGEHADFVSVDIRDLLAGASIVWYIKNSIKY